MTQAKFKSKKSRQQIPNLKRLVKDLWEGIGFIYYKFYQLFVISVFVREKKESIKSDDGNLGRIAIIGTGITGIASAAHCVSHGFDVVIYEKKSDLGGIWADVNRTSGLQLDSLLYRFHPTVFWSRGTPVNQPEIISQIRNVWEKYRLQSCTRFNYTVQKVERHSRSDGKTQWTINDGEDGVFDGLIVAIGTCGHPKTLQAVGREKFGGTIVHSSKMDGLEFKNKRVVAIGGGASAAEAAELAIDCGASKVAILTRTDKWFIPRHWLPSTIPSLFPRHLWSFLGPIFEHAIKRFHYSDLAHLAPSQKSLYSVTPIINDVFLQHVRSNKARYIRGDLFEILPEGLRINVRSDSNSKPGDPGVTEILEADVLIDATGYDRPSHDFLPTAELFPSKKYSPPNLFLQNFTTVDPSCLMNNAATKAGFGTIGHFHIGILTRMLMMFLLQPETAPNCNEMQNWVDKTGDLGYFTYSELMNWLIVFHLTNFKRLRWSIFTLMGLGSIRKEEKRLTIPSL